MNSSILNKIIDYNSLVYNNNFTQVVYFQDEVFKDIPINRWYQISNYGRVFSKVKLCLLYPYRTTLGYVSYCLDGHHYLAHRLVMMAFNPKPYYENPSLMINHINENKSDNRLCNLEWVSNSQNVAYSNERKREFHRESNSSFKFSNSDKHKICKMLEDGIPTKDIAKEYGIEFNDKRYRNFVKILSKVRSNIRWINISSQYNINTPRHTEDEIRTFCELIQNGYNTKQISEILNIPCNNSLYELISSIKHRKRWIEISKDYDFSQYELKSNEEIETYCDLISKGYNYKEIAKITNQEPTKKFRIMIMNIRNGTTYKNFSKHYNFTK